MASPTLLFQALSSAGVLYIYIYIYIYMYVCIYIYPSHSTGGLYHSYTPS